MISRMFMIVSIVFLSYNFAKSQETQIGVKISWSLFQVTGGGYIDKWLVYNDNYADEGTSIGIFLQKNFKRFYAQVELQYSNNWDGQGILNTNVQKLPYILPSGDTAEYEMSEITAIGGPEKYRTIEIPIILGTQLWKRKGFNIRGFVGLQPFILFEGDAGSYLNPNIKDPNYGHLRINAVSDAANRSYHLFHANYLLGGGIDIWKFTFDVRYIRSLTNLSTHAEFEGKTYSLVRRAAQVSFSLGYKFNLKTPKTKSQ
jgi:hypothetical protein